jgi:hypothetical protein
MISARHSAAVPFRGEIWSEGRVPGPKPGRPSATLGQERAVERQTGKSLDSIARRAAMYCINPKLSFRLFRRGSMANRTGGPSDFVPGEFITLPNILSHGQPSFTTTVQRLC